MGMDQGAVKLIHGIVNGVATTVFSYIRGDLPHLSARAVTVGLKYGEGPGEKLRMC